MSSIYDKFISLTPDEQSFIVRNPHHALTIHDSKEKAFKETMEQFGSNGRNDETDAFRHCFWAATLARDIGYKNALEFTTAHESAPNNPLKEQAMDLHNNKVGLELGKKDGSDKGLSFACKSSLLAGELQVLK